MSENREEFEAYIDAYTVRLNSRMKEKYRANGHKPRMAEMDDLELAHEIEEEFDETMMEVSWAALARQNERFMKASDDLELESADLNNYLCEAWIRASALEKLEVEGGAGKEDRSTPCTESLPRNAGGVDATGV